LHTTSRLFEQLLTPLLDLFHKVTHHFSMFWVTSHTDSRLDAQSFGSFFNILQHFSHPFSMFWATSYTPSRLVQPILTPLLNVLHPFAHPFLPYKTTFLTCSLFCQPTHRPTFHKNAQIDARIFPCFLNEFAFFITQKTNDKERQNLTKQQVKYVHKKLQKHDKQSQKIQINKRDI
jgi:hypothetical protein